MTITPYAAIVPEISDSANAGPHWLDYFDPQAAMDELIAYAESQASSRNPERSTMRAYLTSLADVAAYLGALVIRRGPEDYTIIWDQMEPPTKTAIQNYIAWSLKKGRKAKTVNRHLAAVRLFIKAIWEQPVYPQTGQDFIFIMEAQRQFHMAATIKNPPADYIDHRPELDQHGERLTLTEINRLFETFAGGLDKLENLRDRALLYLGITSGLRAAELARVTLDSIKTSEDNVHIIQVRRKRNNHTPAALDAKCVRFIHEWVDAWNANLDYNDPRRIISSTPVFQPLLKGGKIPTGDVKEGITPRAISQIVHRRTLSALGKGIKAHDMRRTCAFQLRSAGVEWDVTQKQMGHKNIGTTALYVGQQTNYSSCLLSNYITINVPDA